MIVRPLASLMLAAALASGLLACPGSTTIVGGGDAASDEGEVVPAPTVDGGAPDANTNEADPDPVGTTPPVACTLKNLKPKAGACATCIETSCCDEWSACDKSADCLQLGACASKCAKDDTCTKACTDAHPSGVAPLVAASNCLKGSCATACN